MRKPDENGLLFYEYKLAMQICMTIRDYWRRNHRGFPEYMLTYMCETAPDARGRNPEERFKKAILQFDIVCKDREYFPRSID